MSDRGGGLIEGLRYDVHGPGSGPTLLLVHGFLSSRAQWRPNLAALAKVCTPVTVELLGHGRSASPGKPEAYSVHAYLSRFEVLRERLGAERWFVCGQSFGAGLTIRYALEHPARVMGQIFTNSISGIAPRARGGPEQREDRAAEIEAGGREFLRSLPFHPRASRRLPKECWEDLVADAALLSPGAVAQAIRVTVPELSVAADLRRITVPTLLVNGTREAAFQPMRDRCVRDIAGLTIVDLDGGHAVNLECAEGFNAAVADFILNNQPSPRNTRLR